MRQGSLTGQGKRQEMSWGGGGDEALCPMHRSLPMTQEACLDETGNWSSKSCWLGLGSTWRGFESGFEAEWGKQRSCLLRPWVRVRVRGGAEDPQR